MAITTRPFRPPHAAKFECEWYSEARVNSMIRYVPNMWFPKLTNGETWTAFPCLGESFDLDFSSSTFGAFMAR